MADAPDLDGIKELLLSRSRSRTHWSACYLNHIDCAAHVLLAEVERLRVEVDEHRERANANFDTAMVWHAKNSRLVEGIREAADSVVDWHDETRDLLLALLGTSDDREPTDG